MHVEKNIAESLVGTLLNVPRKTKDGVNARLDLAELWVKPELFAMQEEDKTTLPPVGYTLTNAEKYIFCEMLYNIRVPQGYCLNFSSFVSLKDRKLISLKSKEIKLQELDKMQAELVVTLCLLEKFFPSSFFDIMVHLTVHLTRENTDELVPYIERHEQVLKTENPSKRIAFLENEHSKSFTKWLRKELGTFDVVIGMDWLSERDAVIVCGEKVVRIPYGNKTLIVEGDRGASRLKVISCIKARKYIERGCQLYLAHVTEKEPAKKRLEDVPVIRDFPEVFPDDLPGLLQNSPNCNSLSNSLPWSVVIDTIVGNKKSVGHFQSCN
ncbi:putative reverse transcriptase domain-containing protein [Tanacetum coccineum]